MNKFIAQNNRFVRLMQHVAFWVLAFFVLIEIFAYEDHYTKVDYLYTGIFMFTLLIPVYLNLWVMVPRLLSRRKGLWYMLFVAGLIVLGSAFNYYLFKDFIDYVFPGYYFISYYALTEIVVFFLAFLFVTTVLKLSKEWFHLLESKRKLAQIEKEKVEAEMKMLKSHLDPHFLFNSLNVIYSLARKNHEKTSDAVIQLSDIMRFITYDAKEKTIEISDEVTLIEKYIALQNYRLEKEAMVEFEKQIDLNIEIAPLLLLPLVENAYKHGIKGNIRNGWIKILLRTETNNIEFEITNSIGEDQVQHDSVKGSGLNNIRQRLELIYPGNHTFEIAKEKDKFKVHLSIEV